MDEKPLTVRQAAEHLQVKPITVLRWIKAGRLQASMPGGTKMGYRISGHEVARLLEEGQRNDG